MSGEQRANLEIKSECPALPFMTVAYRTEETVGPDKAEVLKLGHPLALALHDLAQPLLNRIRHLDSIYVQCRREGQYKKKSIEDYKSFLLKGQGHVIRMA